MAKSVKTGRVGNNAGEPAERQGHRYAGDRLSIRTEAALYSFGNQ